MQRPTFELTGRGDYIQPSIQASKQTRFLRSGLTSCTCRFLLFVLQVRQATKPNIFTRQQDKTRVGRILRFVEGL
jgi:hypothetical protein